MDYQKRFLELQETLHEQMPQLEDIHSDYCSFFFHSKHEELDAISFRKDMWRLPKKISNLLEHIDNISLFESFNHQMRSRPMKRYGTKKMQEVLSFSELFLAYSGGISTAIEIACGSGYLSNYLAVQMPQKKFIGIDIDPYVIQKAISLSNGNRSNITFQIRDAFNPITDIISGHTATLCLHGCGGLSQSVLMQDSEMTMVSPCCYSRLAPKNYLMSEFCTNNLALSLDERYGSIATLGSKNLNEKEQQNKVLKMIETFEYISTQDNNLALLELAGISQSGLMRMQPMDAVLTLHDLKRRYAAAKKVFSRPIEALFSCDKAVYLEENGRSSQIYEYVPFHISPRNHLILGLK
ncbi:MAG: class I SAM-dependent methyltransferase [Candidatus Woesearchaeota archaeon]|nr:class I SAM-dependent methyltransferase [Candidatus Woesearchaeota archaeon]